MDPRLPLYTAPATGGRPDDPPADRRPGPGAVPGPRSTPSGTARRQRLVAATWGIFGHGNVAGLGQALLEAGPARHAVPPGPQRAGHGARRRRLRPAARPALRARRHHLHRPRRHQPRHRRRARHRQPAPGAAAARRHLRHPPRRPGAPAARSALRRRRLGQRRAAPGLPLLRPDHPPRGTDPGRAPGDAGARRPGGDRRRHPRPAAGRAGRGVRLARGVLRRADLAGPPPGARPGRAGRRRARRCAPPGAR